MILVAQAQLAEIRGLQAVAAAATASARQDEKAAPARAAAAADTAPSSLAAAAAGSSREVPAPISPYRASNGQDGQPPARGSVAAASGAAGASAAAAPSEPAAAASATATADTDLVGGDTRDDNEDQDSVRRLRRALLWVTAQLEQEQKRNADLVGCKSSFVVTDCCCVLFVITGSAAVYRAVFSRATSKR